MTTTPCATLFLYAKDASSKSVNFPQGNHSKAVAAAAPIIDDLHVWMDRVAQAKSYDTALNAAARTRALYDFCDNSYPPTSSAKLIWDCSISTT